MSLTPCGPCDRTSFGPAKGASNDVSAFGALALVGLSVIASIQVAQGYEEPEPETKPARSYAIEQHFHPPVRLESDGKVIDHGSAWGTVARPCTTSMGMASLISWSATSAASSPLIRILERRPSRIRSRQSDDVRQQAHQSTHLLMHRLKSTVCGSNRRRQG